MGASLQQPEPKQPLLTVSNQWLDSQTDSVRYWLAESRCPMIVSDSAGAFLWVNKAAENLFGYTTAEFVGIDGKPGLSWYTLTVRPQDLEADKAMVQELESGGREEYTLEKSYRAKDDSSVPTRIHVLRWPPVGECTCFLVTILPLNAQNELLKDEVIAMRHTLTQYIADQSRPRESRTWLALVALAKWGDKNRTAAAFVLLFLAALIFGDRALDVWDRIWNRLPTPAHESSP